MRNITPSSEPAVPTDAIARLRGRTDEIELIISSLTIFALFSLPGWVFSAVADVYTHQSTSLLIASNVGITLLAGTCYTLGLCFVVHLMARAYWVGLIGLRSVFPEGIRWDRVPSLGPLSRRFYEERLPDLDSVIQSTDRLASSLFGVISMLTLSVLWFGTLLVFVLTLGGVLGTRFGATNLGINLGSLTLAAVVVVTPVLIYLLDTVLARRSARLRSSPVYRGLVRVLRRIAGIAYPQRLVLPVQLTLQSNTRSGLFLVLLFAGVVAILSLGNLQLTAWQYFTVSDQFEFLDDAQLESGFRSTYYEDMASSMDRLRGWPRIDSFNQSGAFVRLFLPYLPVRDNLVLAAQCGQRAAAPERTACLRSLWTVRVAGQSVSLADFLRAERADLNMRGLVGLVPLTDLAPGLHRLEVLWNAAARGQAQALDDRYRESDGVYSIPFALVPALERTLD
ncbi:MAG: hypothetical protein AAF648_12660 [Pseudomonadota bacterium]